MLTDTHCHIFLSDYEDIAQVLQNACENNVGRIINNATDKSSMLELLEMLKKYDNMYGALGIHPEFADTYKEEDLNLIENNLSNPQVIAIGEIGLDYHYSNENKEQQIALFEQQLKMAEKYNMPVIIHNRQATDDILKSIKKFKVKGVIHCFNGSIETAKEYLKLGYKLGINGVVTFKNCNLKETLKKLTLEDLVLETDSPYLTPAPFRGQKNEPKYIKSIAEFVANIYDVPVSQVEKITNVNIRHIFDI